MIRLVGFEGGMNSLASWGAAAVDVDGLIQNTVSGRSTTIVKFRELALSESVSEVEPVAVDEDVLATPAVLLRIARTVDLPSRRPLGLACMKKWAAGGQQFWLFESAGKLQNVLSTLVDELTRAALQVGELEDYLRLSAILCPGHPEMNALWAHRKGTRLAWRMARSAAGEGGRQRVERMRDALAGESHVTLVFDGGSASLHRMRSHAMAAVSAALERALGEAASEAAGTHPFLEQIPRPEVQERRAASVDWLLRLEDDNDYAAVAKRLTWMHLRDSLTSEEPSTDVRFLLSPDDGVRLEKVEVGDQEIRPNQLPIARGVAWSKRVSASEVQKQRVGRSMPYLRLTKGSLVAGDYADVEGGWPSYFRERFFSSLEWEGESPVETAQVELAVRFPGYFLPKVRFQLDHKDDRSHHSEPKTFLVWPPEILAILRHGYFVGYDAILERENDLYTLTMRPGAR